MALCRQSRALLLGPSVLLLAAAWLQMLRPHLHVVDGVSKLLISILAVSLLIVVVDSSAEIRRAVVKRLRALSLSSISTLLVQPRLVHSLQVELPFEEPILPFRFQRPPPYIAA
jgi:hypothetical protein